MTNHLDALPLFQHLDAEERAALSARLERVAFERGRVIIRQGDVADAMYVVVTGRLAVTVDGIPGVVAEIGPGQPVGEIAFLSGGRRTATVTALRDGLLLRLERNTFEVLSAQHPSIWRSLTITLAERIADNNAKRALETRAPPRTITFLPAGERGLPADLRPMLERIFAASNRIACASSSDIARMLGTAAAAGTDDATALLNALEADHDYVLYFADDALTPWSQKAIRQADLVVAVADVRQPDNNPQLNALERFAANLHEPRGSRLLLLHRKVAVASGTGRWLLHRPVTMHHHATLDDDDGLARFLRFVAGRARGLVVCGGGAFCAAHVGVYKALRERGVTFDILGGTSGGGAMAAAFALDIAPDIIDAAIHDIFVTHNAMRRYTWPKYSLLDHTHFDALLQKHYGAGEIEDMWRPFFTVAANLSRYELEAIKSGPLWRAVRATGSIPALLPPVYTPEGEMLVDGALMDNAPVGVMHALKTGPNIVITFSMPRDERFHVDYETLPSRRQLLRTSRQSHVEGTPAGCAWHRQRVDALPARKWTRYRQGACTRRSGFVAASSLRHGRARLASTHSVDGRCLSMDDQRARCPRCRGQAVPVASVVTLVGTSCCPPATCPDAGLLNEQSARRSPVA